VETILNSEVTSNAKIVQVFAEFVQQSENQLLTSLNEQPRFLHKLGDMDSKEVMKLKEDCNFWKGLNPPKI